MNPYLVLGFGLGTNEATSLGTRLSAWHDAMVAHERRLGDVCDDDCPHAEARGLWPEAVELFGARARELTFLRSRATTAPLTGGDMAPEMMLDVPHLITTGAER